MVRRSCRCRLLRARIRCLSGRVGFGVRTGREWLWDWACLVDGLTNDLQDTILPPAMRVEYERIYIETLQAF